MEVSIAAVVWSRVVPLNEPSSAVPSRGGTRWPLRVFNEIEAWTLSQPGNISSVAELAVMTADLRQSRHAMPVTINLLAWMTYAQNSREICNDNKNDNDNHARSPYNVYTMGLKPTLVLYTITSMHIKRFGNFGSDVAETVCYQTVICYPTSPN